MAKPFKELLTKMSPERMERAKQRSDELLKEMPLWELRQARHLSQVKLAEKLKINQSAVSKLERRADMYISTLREVIAVMGGELEIVAKFPDGDVKIKQFHEDLKTA